MQVTFKPVVGQRKRQRDGKAINVPAKSPCGAAQLSILIDGKEIGLVLDRAKSPVSYLVRDLTDQEKTAVDEAIALRTGVAPSGSQQPPAEDSYDVEPDDDLDTDVDFD
ncbi:hypothetical protein Poly24_08870 [Rosistilla carotiformis]|uniref:Uncharacterized protein n=1 Tax=Rosistilla carotiformis TaxID=2528017 RepID=A0A518JNS0_9BACT|nr:hypothetical protein [Rosistilla carotiformis]QDV67195.1 hypothetical protein Poly24_08870 [Rosistilla carotiformis]